MRKPPTKVSRVEPSQLSLFELLEKEEGNSVEWPVQSDDIGGELLAILSKGLYPDPLDCIREYVQNSVDALAKTVTIRITGNSVIISDDGFGMNLNELVQARKLALSPKSRAEHVGFRGIGIYAGFDICSRLLVTTKKAGEPKSRILEFDFEAMKAQLKMERETQSQRMSLIQLLTKYTHFKQEDDQVDRHYTIVQLEELSRVHIGQLSDREHLRNYILHNLPIDFADNFPHKEQITNQLKNQVPGYNAIKVKLLTDFAPPEIIVRPNIPYLRQPIMGEIRNSDSKKIAYYWACLHAEGKEISDDFSEYRGLVYKVKGFTIGNRSPLRAHFTTAKGTLYDWYTGEVYVIDENVVPNAARNDFEASPEKLQLETAVGDVMRDLNRTASKFQEQKNADKDFEKVSGFLNEEEKKVESYNLGRCKEVYQQLERHLENLTKKQKKTTLDQSFVQETIQRAEKLKGIVRNMIDHPDEPSKHQSTVNEPSLVGGIPPFPAAKPSSEPTQLPKSISTTITATSESKSNITSPPKPTPNVAIPPKPTLVKTLMQVFERSGLDINESCTQLIRIIDRSLSSLLVRETYERVLDDLEARLDYEVTGEVESEEE